MKITDVKAVYVDHGPGPRPFSDGGYRDQKRVFGYVEVFSDEGLTGFCPGAAPPALVEHDLKDMIVGENPLEVERIWHRLFQGWRHPKMDDLMPISKVDTAIWDLLGKALQQSVYRASSVRPPEGTPLEETCATGWRGRSAAGDRCRRRRRPCRRRRRR